MKTLTTIILLLIAIMGYSQIGANGKIVVGDNISDSCVAFGHRAMTVKEYLQENFNDNGVLPFRDDIVKCEPTFEERLLKLLQEYETDCYNDSTLRNVYIDPNYTQYDKNGFGYRTTMGGYYEKQWTRKEPTFKGFINWLKDK